MAKPKPTAAPVYRGCKGCKVVRRIFAAVFRMPRK